MKKFHEFLNESKDIEVGDICIYNGHSPKYRFKECEIIKTSHDGDRRTFRIKFEDGYITWTVAHSLKEKEKPKDRVRWYDKGKLINERFNAGDSCLYINDEDDYYQNCVILKVIKADPNHYMIKLDDDSFVLTDEFHLKNIEKDKTVGVKWYSKGKFKKEEEWKDENENKIFFIKESKDPNMTNLSIFLEPLTQIAELRAYLTSEQFFRFLDQTVEKASIQNGKRITALCKKYNLENHNFDDAKIHTMYIDDFDIYPDGLLEIISDADVYLIDLVKCAKEPFKYPIYVQKPIVKFTEDDPYGEEDWANESHESHKDFEYLIALKKGEYWKAMRYLHDLGYMWIDKTSLLDLGYMWIDKTSLLDLDRSNRYDPLALLLRYDKKMKYGRYGTYGKENYITLDEFISAKKELSDKNKEIDPYEEEDWSR